MDNWNSRMTQLMKLDKRGTPFHAANMTEPCCLKTLTGTSKPCTQLNAAKEIGGRRKTMCNDNRLTASKQTVAYLLVHCTQNSHLLHLRNKNPNHHSRSMETSIQHN